ncbi:MAG: Fic family protein [Oxalobacter sp.]|nr:Fic family protein [Oxalobacter sp.]
MWIHEYPEWPSFFWRSEHLMTLLGKVRWRQGYLLGRMRSLDKALRQEALLDMFTDEVVASSAIEGIHLNSAEVRSSIARRLGITTGGFVPSSRYIDGVVEMMLDAVRQFNAPLTKERLFSWHAALFPTGRSGLVPIATAQWRAPDAGPMQVVSGAIGHEKVHFEAPAAMRVDQEMAVFLKWFAHDASTDPVLKAGIAHLWFITIHPFEDGNGRIARAITDMALARADQSAERFYSLSRQIEIERSDYYDQLERQQRGTLDITQWLAWFLSCIDRALDASEATVGRILAKAAIWEQLKHHPANDRQRKILRRMLSDDFEGFMNTRKYARMAQCSKDTALRDIQALMAWGILIQNPGRERSVSYRIVDDPLA